MKAIMIYDNCHFGIGAKTIDLAIYHQTPQTKMTSFRVRPKFKITSEKPVRELVDLINRKLESNTSVPVEGKVFHTHGLFRITPEQQHYWSPQLNISFEETDEHKTIIRGMYGPHPSVWAVFLMGYALLGIGTLVISLLGLVRMSLKLDSSILWTLPFLVGGLVILWFLAQTGQKVGVEQTFIIHHFFEEAIEEPVHISKIR